MGRAGMSEPPLEIQLTVFVLFTPRTTPNSNTCTLIPSWTEIHHNDTPPSCNCIKQIRYWGDEVEIDLLRILFLACTRNA
jgi:hypothetical protein